MNCSHDGCSLKMWAGVGWGWGGGGDRWKGGGGAVRGGEVVCVCVCLPHTAFLAYVWLPDF